MKIEVYGKKFAFNFSTGFPNQKNQENPNGHL